MSEGRLGPEVGHPKGLLERKARGQDFPVDRFDCPARKGPITLPGEAVDDFLLPLRGVVSNIPLGLLLPDPHHDLGPAIQQPKDLAVKGVYLLSELFDSHLSFSLINPFLTHICT